MKSLSNATEKKAEIDFGLKGKTTTQQQNEDRRVWTRGGRTWDAK